MSPAFRMPRPTALGPLLVAILLGLILACGGGGSTPPSPVPPPSVDGPAWIGTGRTVSIPAGGDIQAAIDAASPGDTLELADGTWVGATLSLTKKLRLRAVHPLGALLQGHAAPTESKDRGIFISTAAAAGSMVEGLHIKWYGLNGIGVQATTDVGIRGNRIESCGGQGVFLYDTKDVWVFGNEILDPYLAGHHPTAIDVTDNTNWTFNNTLVLMDYGVQAYGTLRTKVERNYFHGQFNQTVSFKEGNQNYAVLDNTFEGFTGTAVLFGQNTAQYGPYPTSGLPKANDTGTLIASGNLFRPVVGHQDLALAEYRASGALRLGHVENATVTLDHNVLEGAITGIQIDMDVNGAAGGPTGSVEIHHNIINGRLYDNGTFVSSTAQTRNVGVQALQIKSGVLMNVAIHHETYLNSAYAIQNLGGLGTVTLDRSILSTANSALYGPGITVVTRSTFFACTAAIPTGTGVITVDPQFMGSTVTPLMMANPRVGLPQSDLSQRLQPKSTSPCKLGDGTYMGAVAPAL